MDTYCVSFDRVWHLKPKCLKQFLYMMSLYLIQGRNSSLTQLCYFRESFPFSIIEDIPKSAIFKLLNWGKALLELLVLNFEDVWWLEFAFSSLKSIFSGLISLCHIFATVCQYSIPIYQNDSKYNTWDYLSKIVPYLI